MFKYDKYITNSLIITKYINKTYEHKNKCLLLNHQVSKREIIETQIEHTRLSFLDRQSSDQIFFTRYNDPNHRSMSSLVKVPPYSKWNFQGGKCSFQTGVILL
jgi:hypothetical protein